MTEAELILASLTLEELDDARRFVGMLEQAWIAGTKDEGTRRYMVLRTDGPGHALNAMKLAVLREMTGRGGGEAWFAGASLEGHPAAGLLRLYQRRFAMRELEPRPNAAGVLERICIACGAAKPQDEATFERFDGLWSDRCRACSRIDVGNIPMEALDVPVAPEPPVDVLGLL
jgi:hypothetical protein